MLGLERLAVVLLLLFIALLAKSGSGCLAGCANETNHLRKWLKTPNMAAESGGLPTRIRWCGHNWWQLQDHYVRCLIPHRPASQPLQVKQTSQMHPATAYLSTTSLSCLVPLELN